MDVCGISNRPVRDNGYGLLPFIDEFTATIIVPCVLVTRSLIYTVDEV